MACRIGMSTDPKERIDHWKQKENCTSGTVIASGLTYDEALAREQQEARAGGCRHDDGGPRIAGRVWSVYRMDGQGQFSLAGS